MKRVIARCLFASLLPGTAVTAGAADNVTVSWQEGEAGLWRWTKLPEAEWVYDVQSADGVVYFATDRGIYMAREGGRTWTRYVNLNNGKPVPFYSIAAAIPDIEQVNPSIGMEALIRYLAVDGPVLFAATMDGRVYRYPVPRGTTSLPPTTGAELDIQNRLDAAFASQNMTAVDSLIATVQGMNDWSPVLPCYRGYRRLLNQDPAGALGDFNQLLSLQSGVVDAYFFRGLAYQNLGRHPAAIQDFTVVISNKSARAAFAQGNRGISWLHLNDPIKARTDPEAAVKAGVTDAQKYIDQYLK
jgi:tetratricopeptide (TPR) repeat protein